MTLKEIESLIVNVPNFPKKGVLFRDITELLKNPTAFQETIIFLKNKINEFANKPTLIAGAESRGFVFGVALAQQMNLGFIPIRKKDKLPRARYTVEYSLEYGNDYLEMHMDASSSSDRVLIVDDILATGGTAIACTKLIEKSGAEVLGCLFLIELSYLNGRELLENYHTESLFKY